MEKPDIRGTFATAEAIYGTILVAGLIVAATNDSTTSWEDLLTTVGTVVVFWAAHVYARAVATFGSQRDPAVGLVEAIGEAFERSWGLLTASLFPTFFLVLGAGNIVVDEIAVMLALWSCVAILAGLAYSAFSARTNSIVVRVVGSAATAGFGIAVIVLYAIVHMM